MAIKTSTFGGVTLTGEAAKAFRKQFLTSKPKPNPLATAAYVDGMRLLKEMKKKGYATVKSKKRRLGILFACKLFKSVPLLREIASVLCRLASRNMRP